MNLPSLVLKRHYNFVQHFLLQFLRVISILEYPFDTFDINQLENVVSLNN
jgi:hypothetical protein